MKRPISLVFGLIITALCSKIAYSVTDNYGSITQNRLAINQYIRTLNPSVASSNSWTIADQLAGAGNSQQIDPKFVAAIIAVESRYNFRAYNHGAAGLGQLMPSTARNVGIKDPFSITENAIGTTKYVKNQFDYFGGGVTEYQVLASYLQGPMRVRKQQSKFPNRVYRYIQSVMAHYDAIKSIFKTIPTNPFTSDTSPSSNSTVNGTLVPTVSLTATISTSMPPTVNLTPKLVSPPDEPAPPAQPSVGGPNSETHSL